MVPIADESGCRALTAGVFVALGLSLTLAGVGCSGGRAIARVNGKPVTETQWMEAMIREYGPSELLGLIDEVIIRQEATRLGIKADEQDVRAKIDELASLAGSRDELGKRLEQLHMTMDDLGKRAEVLVLLDKLVRSRIKVDDAQIVAYYRQHAREFTHEPRVRARIMLFASKENAEAVAEALKAGGDFAGLAKELSEDPGTKSDGGDTGWVEEHDYAPAISKVLFALKPGQTSLPFQGPDGWYIVRVEATRPAGLVPLAEVREQIERRLIQERMMSERAHWLIEQRRKAVLVIKDRRLAEGVRDLLTKAPPPNPVPGLMMPDSLFMDALQAGLRGKPLSLEAL